MADEEINEEQLDLQVPEMWALAKPPMPEDDEDDDDAAGKKKKKQPPGAKVGKLVKLLNDIEDPEELDAKVQERDPATGQTLLQWATLQGKFVLVEWLVKKCKRSAFAFLPGADHELAIFDKWVEIRKEVEERERERAANPPEEAGGDEDDEEKAAEPTADQLVFEALAEYQEEWGARGQGIVKSIGELGVYQGARDAEQVKNGLGQTLFPNGDMYTGEYRANMRSGTGTYFWANDGVLYTGQWRDNLRHGIGRCVYPDGGRYLGAWAGDKKNGDGRYTYPDGSSYAGAWVADVKHGFGTYALADGSQFVGTFVDGEFTSGEWRLADGTRYVGAFKDDVPVGAGVFLFKGGRDGAYSQEGQYIGGAWHPAGDVQPADALPSLQVTVQKRVLTLRFDNECGGLSVEALVALANFGPFREWIAAVDAAAPQGTFNLTGVSVTALSFTPDGKDIAEARLRTVVTDAEGKRLRATDSVVLRAPATRLLVLLISGDREVVVLERGPSAAAATAAQLRLPAVRAAPNGGFLGAFIDVVEPALRLSLRREFTLEVLPAALPAPHASTARENVVAYVRHVHADVLATIGQRLAAAGAAGPLTTLRALRLQEVAGQSTDATTVAAVARVLALRAASAMPRATVEDQRPPTPIAPAPEPRPDIQPLLAEQKKLEAAAAAAADDE